MQIARSVDTQQRRRRRETFKLVAIIYFIKMRNFLSHYRYIYILILISTSIFYPSNGHSQHGDITQHPSWMLLDHAKCGLSNSDRIIGGKNASMGSYPWITRIAYSNILDNEQDEANSEAQKKQSDLAYRCGGTLINKMYVVTAAHCVSNLPQGYKVAAVRLGEHNIETNPDCENGYCAEPVQDFTPVQIIVHRKYNEPPFKNDIAIIRLDRAVTYNNWVMPICLPSGELLEKDFIAEKGEVAGWGIYDINDPKSSVILQTIKLPIVVTERCKKSFAVHADIGKEQMCVGGEVGADSCGGDSGGPLMKVEANSDGYPKYYFIGVVSFGAKHCGESAVPAVYSKISYYIEWILDNVSP